MNLKKLGQSYLLRGSIAAIAAAAFAAPLYAADTTAADNAVNLLLPFTTLNSTATGQATLYANLFGAQGTVGINNNSTAAQRQQAVYDNYVLYLSGQPLALADGLGTKLNSALTNNGAALVNPSLTNLNALLTAATSLTGSHSATAKTFFGNGKTTATTATLPSNGAYAVYDAYYKTVISPFYQTNSAGNSRPFQVLGFDSTSHPSIESFTATYTGPTVTVGSGSTAITITTGDTISNKAISLTDGGTGVTANAAAPSGHTTWGYTQAILLAVLAPERYLETLTRGSEYGNSRLVLGVHYPLDVIMGRALASYDIAQMLNNNPAYTSGGTVNYQTLFASARNDLVTASASCGGISACIALSSTDRFSNAAQNKADYAARLTYGLPTLSFTQAPREAAPTGGPDASILLATVYGGSTAAAKTLANAVGGPTVADLTTSTINQIIVNTETNAIAAFYGTSLSYWTRINLYDAASYLDAVSTGFTGSLITSAGDNIRSGVTVASGGVFGGSGTVNGALDVKSGGALGAKGDGSASYTPLTVTGAGTLEKGSSVQLTGVFLPGTVYTLVNAAGGVTADPGVAVNTSTAGDLLTLFSGQWAVNANKQLQIELTSHLANAAETSNQRSVALALDSAGNAGGFSANGVSFLDGLIANNTTATAPATFASLSGEGLTAQQNAAFGAGNLFVTTVLGQATFWADDRSNDIFGLKDGGGLKDAPVPASHARLWASGFGQYASLDGQGSHGGANQSSNNSGVATGIDYEVAPGVILGLTGGYSNSNFSVNDRATSGTVEGGYIGGYGVGHYGPFYFAGTIDYANFDNKASRSVTGLGAIGVERAKFSSDEFIARFEGGSKYEWSGVTVTPFAGFQVATLSNDAFSETGLGGSLAGLRVNAQDIDSDRAFAGLQLSAKTAIFNGWSLTPYVRASWEHEFNPDRSITASFLALPGAQFTVYGAGAAEDLAHVNAGFKLDVTASIAAFAAFDGEFSDRGDSYAGTGGLRIRW